MLGGIITKVKPLTTKKGKNPGAEMCQFWVDLPIELIEEDVLLEEDDEEVFTKDESVQIVEFPSAYARAKENLEVGKPVLVEVEKLRDGLSLRSVYRLDKLKAS